MRKLTKEEKTLMYKLQYIHRGGAEGARLRQKKWRDRKKHKHDWIKYDRETGNTPIDICRGCTKTKIPKK